MTVAVTGGAGFLGIHLVQALQEAGEEVRLLLRPGRRPIPGPLQTLRGEIVRGDLARGELPDGFPGPARALIHAAARYSEDPAALDELLATNERGTELVLAAAARDGVRRIVHVSTMGTCAPRPDGRPATEEDHVGLAAASPYAISKIRGERAALARARELGVVVVNPAAIVGAWDAGPSVTGARIRSIVSGRWPVMPPGPVNYVPARTCAAGILRALDRGRPGERYLLGGENVEGRDLVRRVAAAAGVPPPRRPFRDRWHAVRPRGPRGLAIDDSKARRELGHDGGDLDQAFREAAAWIRGESGPVRRSR